MKTKTKPVSGDTPNRLNRISPTANFLFNLMFLIIALACVMALSLLAGCGNDPAANSEGSAPSTPITEENGVPVITWYMMAYGEEGVNFEYVDMALSDGTTEQRVHKLNSDRTLAAYTQGKTIHMTPEDTSEVNPYVDEILVQNETARRSPAMGFCFDNSEVADQLSVCVAIFNEYKGIIHTGTGDPEANVAAMMSAMRASGFDDIVAEVQRQLDEYLASK